ncbi:uncharacterized protein LOC127535821 [Acanthochromis polyacanthus]|uniref:uncharacterized protein LOC127535821 n=1 Tax=Acanthochromis polyacanthus TaxID=80966 RepID=UPI0022344C6E|nr:uncharacterized protein LOC127535821 [Acanthochromis polyacanthus]
MTVVEDWNVDGQVYMHTGGKQVPLIILDLHLPSTTLRILGLSAIISTSWITFSHSSSSGHIKGNVCCLKLLVVFSCAADKNSQKTSDYTVVQSTASHSVHPGESQTLQCSVFSDSDKKTCSGDLSVFWFRPGSDKSHPDIIYTDGNRPDECEKRSDTQKSCVYRFSKTFSSSDAGTYYCAVATCGQILFGNGTTLTNETLSQTTRPEMIALVVAIICLAISVIINIVFIGYQTQRGAQERLNGIEFTSSQARLDNLSQPVVDTVEGEHDINYTSLHFSGRKATQGKKKTELKCEESVYSQVHC